MCLTQPHLGIKERRLHVTVRAILRYQVASNIWSASFSYRHRSPGLQLPSSKIVMAAFIPSTPSLPLSTRHDTIDIIIAVVFTAFAVTQKLWAQHLPISDDIPEHFWHQIPQKASSQSSSLAVQVKSRNVKHVFTQHVSWCYAGRCNSIANSLTGP